MCWVFVPGLEGLSSESELPSPERAECVTWRGKPMQPRTLSRAWKTGGFIRRLSGLTLEHSTLNYGVASYIASLRETPANPTVLPVEDSAPTMIDGLSTKSSGSSTACGLIVSSVRTCRGTVTGSSPHWSRHWKDWATALRQEYSARPKLEPATDGNGCSSWPTARVSAGAYTQDRGNPEKQRPSLEGLAASWATPTTDDKSMRSKPFAQGGTALSTQAGSRVTPRATDGEKGGPNQMFGAGGTPLPAMAANWPTPANRDYRSPNSQESQDRRNAGSKRGQQLPNFLADLSRSSHLVPAIPNGSRSSETRRTLNPLFVEWLMGWPTNWTLADPRSRSEFPRLPSTSPMPCAGGRVTEPAGARYVLGLR